MNQILSVNMPKKTGKVHREGKKASTESVIRFFCIVLLIFGILIAGIGIFSIIKNSNSNQQDVPGTPVVDSPEIYITQNASELEVEVTAENEISKVQYRWNEDEIKEQEGNGTNRLVLNVQVPSGTNTFKIKVTDVEGKTNQFSKEYIGSEQQGNQSQNPTQQGNQSQNQTQQGNEPNVKLEFVEGTNKLKIKCEEEQKIKSVSYYYDSDNPQVTEVNDTIASVEIPVNQGKHDLTVKVVYEDNTEKQITKKLYFPVVERARLSEDGNSLILAASDERKITKVKINFNGEDLPEEEVNNVKFEKTLQLKEGENKLILTVFNSDGVSITRGVKYEKK